MKMEQDKIKFLMSKYKILFSAYTEVLKIKGLSKNDIVFYTNKVDSLNRDIARLKEFEK